MRDESRFRFYQQDYATSRGWTILVGNIRLKTAKPYCTQLPAACIEISCRGHRWANTLEAADWVAFNDMLNDICDAEVIEANIRSQHPKVWIRKGYERRIRYRRWRWRSGVPRWDADGQARDWISWNGPSLYSAPRSWCPPELRGYPWWNPEDPDYSRLQPLVTVCGDSKLTHRFARHHLSWLQKDDVNLYRRTAEQFLRYHEKGLRLLGYQGPFVHLWDEDNLPAELLDLLKARDGIRAVSRPMVDAEEPLVIGARKIRMEV